MIPWETKISPAFSGSSPHTHARMQRVAPYPKAARLWHSRWAFVNPINYSATAETWARSGCTRTPHQPPISITHSARIPLTRVRRITLPDTPQQPPRTLVPLPSLASLLEAPFQRWKKQPRAHSIKKQHSLLI
jgi:hypothetical protein